MGELPNLTSSAKGAVFQAWFFQKVHEGLDKSDLLGCEAAYWWNYYQTMKANFAALKKDNTSPCVVYQSTNENEKAIDGFIYHPKKELKDGTVADVLFLLQITSGKTHKLDLNSCESLAKRLEVTHVEIFFIRPKSDGRTFSISRLTAPSKLKSFKRMDGSDWPQDSDKVKQYVLEKVYRINGW